MSSNAKLIQAAAVAVALCGVALAPSTASAGIFSGIAHAVKSVAKVVSHPKELVKDVRHDVSSAVREVTHPKQLVKDVAHDFKSGLVMRDLHRIGGVVGDVYSGAAKVAKNIPVAKDFRPLMRDFARAARSSEGEIAGAAGAGLAIATGGASSAATAAGGWAYAAFAGKREIKRAPAQIKAWSRM